MRIVFLFLLMSQAHASFDSWISDCQKDNDFASQFIVMIKEDEIRYNILSFLESDCRTSSLLTTKRVVMDLSKLSKNHFSYSVTRIEQMVHHQGLVKEFNSESICSLRNWELEKWMDLSTTGCERFLTSVGARGEFNIYYRDGKMGFRKDEIIFKKLDW